MKKNELIFSIVAGSVFITMIGYGIWKDKAIAADPVDVLATVCSIQDTENGLIYSFTYQYNSVKYEGGVKGFLQLHDSLIRLKISKHNPKLWMIADD